jgi:HNH endonuclease
MSRDEELRGIAIALKKESLYFSGGWNINILQAFIRDGGCCVYCGKEVLKEFSLAFCGDHLLPKSLYPDLAENVDNLVPACAECNLIKHNYDPSEGRGREIVITEQVRSSFILKAKEEITRKRIDYECEFIQTGKVAFEQAVAKYRKL